MVQFGDIINKVWCLRHSRNYRGEKEDEDDYPIL